MLTKRTNLLFDEELWSLLVAIAQKQRSSVGELVRAAVRKTYLDADSLRKRMEIWEKILKARPSPGAVNYRELIAYGRKF